MSSKTERSFRGVRRRMKKFMDEFSGSSGQAARIIGEEVMTDVKASRQGKGVPRDEGILAGSGRVSGPEGERNVVRLMFGGASAPYALVQHERTDFNHTVGEARYLVRGLERWRPGGSAARKALEQMTKEALRKASRG